MNLNYLKFAVFAQILFFNFTCKNNTNQPQFQPTISTQTVDIVKTENNEYWPAKYSGILVYDFDYNGTMNDVILYLDDTKTDSITLNYDTDIFIYKNTTLSFSKEYSNNMSANYGISPMFFEFGGPSFFHCFVISQDENYWKVNFGDFDGFISKKNTRFEFNTYEEYLSNYPIGMDLTQNFVRKSPNMTAEIIKLDADLDWAFDVLQIKGDWMEIQSVNMCDGIDEAIFYDFTGWVKFKEEDTLLIVQLFGC